MRGLIEPTPIQDVFFSRLGGVERIGNGCLRLYLGVPQAMTGAARGIPKTVIVSKLITPASLQIIGMLKLLCAMGVMAATMTSRDSDLLH